MQRKRIREAEHKCVSLLLRQSHMNNFDCIYYRRKWSYLKRCSCWCCYYVWGHCCNFWKRQQITNLFDLPLMFSYNLNHKMKEEDNGHPLPAISLIWYQPSFYATVGIFFASWDFLNQIGRGTILFVAIFWNMSGIINVIFWAIIEIGCYSCAILLL